MGSIWLFCAWLCLIIWAQGIFADVYLHNPRGGNDRLSEAHNNRDNANRLFDSQNNGRGGYNYGYMYYYAGSILPIEWTNQHACGTNNNTDCTMVIQWMCEDTTDDELRDGQDTGTIPDPEPTQERFVYGRHETNEYYTACKTRERNKGLFTSDQNLRGNAAIYTRQNPTGDRHGYECPEERDYYPYWHPSPWKDIAILTDNTSRCEYYQSESQNVKSKNYCSDSRFNNFQSCNASGATWMTAANFSIPPPDCIQTTWSRDNHLGNVLGGFPNYYNWTIPKDADFSKCVLRIRYNISTGDFDYWNINSSLNGRNKLRVGPHSEYFFVGNPIVDIGVGQPLQLAINTAQYGRTFQDRTHSFAIKQRPSSIPSDATIHNLNVRGKRGNIVQVYPAVEYDFVPNHLVIQEGDYVHFQWTGSNSNDPNNDGQGTPGTDRSNIVQLGDSNSLNLNYPLQLQNVTMFPNTSDDNGRFDFIRRIATLNQNDDELNDASPYFDGGVVQMKAGNYSYMCTRNNNFTNRSQKGTILVQPRSDSSRTVNIIVGTTVASTVVVGGLAVGLWLFKTGKLATIIGALKGAAATPTAV